MECVLMLGRVLEKSFYSGFTEKDYEGLLAPGLRFVKFDNSELAAIERKLEEIYLKTKYDDIRGSAIWALGKSNTKESREILKSFLLGGVNNAETGFQLAIALEHAWPNLKSDLTPEELEETTENLKQLGLFGNRVYEVVERIIQGYYS